MERISWAAATATTPATAAAAIVGAFAIATTAATATATTACHGPLAATVAALRSLRPPPAADRTPVAPLPDAWRRGGGRPPTLAKTSLAVGTWGEWR